MEIIQTQAISYWNYFYFIFENQLDLDGFLSGLEIRNRIHCPFCFRNGIYPAGSVSETPILLVNLYFFSSV